MSDPGLRSEGKKREGGRGKLSSPPQKKERGGRTEINAMRSTLNPPGKKKKKSLGGGGTEERKIFSPEG